MGKVGIDSWWIPEIRNNDMGIISTVGEGRHPNHQCPGLRNELSAHTFHSWLDKIFLTFCWCIFPCIVRIAFFWFMHGNLKKVYKCISEKGSCAFYSYYCLVLTISFTFSELHLLIFSYIIFVFKLLYSCLRWAASS